MKAIQYRIFLEQPLLATTLLGDPASSVSFGYIPGSLLRGLLIQHDQQANPVADMAGTPTCRRRFFDARTRYLHAYPLIEHERGLPTPQSLFKYKHAHFDEDTKTIGAFDGSHQRWSDSYRRTLERRDALKSLAKSVSFCTTTARFGYEPARTVAVHVQRDRKQGRGIKGKHPIFQYDALAAEQWFVGVILVEHAEDAAALEQLLHQIDVTWLGRSRSANYGKVRISDVEMLDEWREIADDYAEPGPGDYCTLTLTSDTLLRDNAGNPVTTLDSATLSAYLGTTVTLLPAPTFTAVTAVGGFNRTWHLPLVQQYALESGSVIAFQPDQPLSEDQIRRLEQQGIGERRAEGFGQVVWNWQRALEFSITKVQPDEQALYLEAQTLTTPGTAQRLARQMATRLCEQDITQAITRFVRDYLGDKPDGIMARMPHNSQLARLRMLVRQARPTHDVTRVLQEFRAFRPVARRQFEQVTIRNTVFADWIETLLEQPDTVWQYLSEINAPTIAGQRADLAALSAETALRLLEAVLVAPAHMRKKERA